MRVLRCVPLPDDPLEAAARFHAAYLPQVLAGLGPGLGGGLGGGPALALVFAPADHRQRAWILVAVQALARAAAPQRVNAVTGGDEAAVAAALAWLGDAEGVTGQVLQIDGVGAGAVV